MLRDQFPSGFIAFLSYSIMEYPGLQAALALRRDHTESHLNILVGDGHRGCHHAVLDLGAHNEESSGVPELRGSALSAVHISHGMPMAKLTAHT